MTELACCPNVVVKLGGFGLPAFGLGFERGATPPSSAEVAAVWNEPVQHVVERFGADRCMFESNFPVDQASVSYGCVWNACKRMVDGASETEKQALFSGTARRVYGLDEQRRQHRVGSAGDRGITGGTAMGDRS